MTRQPGATGASRSRSGAGKLWMLAEEGYARDVAVVRLIRRYIGRTSLLGVDCQRRLRRRADQAIPPRHRRLPLAFIEEMFQSPSSQYLSVKALMRDNKWNILIADGENKRFPRDMKSWVDAEAVDILQGDMNQFGFGGHSGRG